MNDAARLGRNFSATAVGQLVSQVLTLLMSVILARALGVVSYGVFVFAFAFPSWLLLIVSVGLDAVLTIDVAADRSKARPYLSAVALLRVPLAFAAFVVLWFSVRAVLSDPLDQTVTIIIGTAMILETYAGTFLATFRAFERMEFEALIVIMERVVTVTLVFVLLNLGFGLLHVSFVVFLGSILNLTFSVTILRRKFVWFAPSPDRSLLRKILWKALPFALSGVVGTFLTSAAPVLLALLRSPEATGEFNAAYALLFALLAFFSIYHTVFLPTMARVYRENPGRLLSMVTRTQKLFFALGLPMTLGGWYYASEIVTLVYGDAFLDSGRSLEVLAFAIAISTAVLGVGTALLATNRQTLSLGIRSVGMMLNFVLCLFLIPPWGAVGASIAYLTATCLMGALATLAVYRLIGPLRLRTTFTKPILVGIAMIALLTLLQRPSLWLGVALGASFYFIVLILIRGLTREDWGVIKDAVRGAVFRRAPIAADPEE